MPTKSKTIKRPSKATAKSPHEAAAPTMGADAAPKAVNLGLLLSKPAETSVFKVWLVGDTPLITHAWSEKARREMLQKQVKATKAARDARDPQEDFVNSLYEMGDKEFGFPVTGIKNAILSVAHKDKGVPRTDARAALFLHANMVRTRPALAGAICDMPLVRIWGSKPEMREDMVRVGAGLNKTASLSYRAQFTTWAIRLTGRLNTSVMPFESLMFLIAHSGHAIGIGEWRNERNGIFGAYHMARGQEIKAWDDFAAGRGKLPQPDSGAAREQADLALIDQIAA